MCSEPTDHSPGRLSFLQFQAHPVPLGNPLLLAFPGVLLAPALLVGLILPLVLVHLASQTVINDSGVLNNIIPEEELHLY